MRRRTWLGVFCAVLLATACGGKTETSGSGGGTGGGTGGVTGGSGGTGGSGATGGVTGGSGGAGGSGGLSPECQALEDQFGAAMAQAKTCNMLVNSLQCTLSIGGDIQCSCLTYVNPGNGAAVQQLNELKGQWQALGCNKGPCPFSCPAPQGSGCTPNGAGGDVGECTDFWPD